MRIGIDLGGTKIEGIALGDDASELVRRRIPAPRGDYRQTLSAIVDLVREIEQEVGRIGTVDLAALNTRLSTLVAQVRGGR